MFSGKYNKGMGSVVSITLFLVVSIVSVIAFQSWYGSFQSTNFVKIETQGDSIEDLNIVNVIGNTLYVQSESNVEVRSIEINKRDCGLAPSLTSGVNTVDVGTCLSGILEDNLDVVLISNDGIYSEKIYLGGGFEEIQFVKHLISDSDGYNSSEGYSLIEVSSGGFALLGDKYNGSNGDMWLVKTDSFGNKLWSKGFDGGLVFGSESYDIGYSLIEVSSGGFALLGTKENGVIGGDDMWLIRTDSNGNELWNATYNEANPDGYSFDGAHSLIETSDGGFALVGFKQVGSGFGNHSIWLVKSDSNGNHLWNKTFYGADDGVDSNKGYAVVETSDGNLVLGGHREDPTGSGWDMWLIKVNSSGSELWNVTFGRGNGLHDVINSIVETSNGDLVLGGQTDFGNAWIVKTDSNGSELWNTSIDGGGYDIGESLVETSDSGFALAGHNSGTGNSHSWLIKANSSGDVLWNVTFDSGNDVNDYAYSLVETSDRGFALLGRMYNGSQNTLFFIKTNSTGGTCDYTGDGIC